MTGVSWSRYGSLGLWWRLSGGAPARLRWRLAYSLGRALREIAPPWRDRRNEAELAALGASLHPIDRAAVALVRELRPVLP